MKNVLNSNRPISIDLYIGFLFLFLCFGCDRLDQENTFAIDIIPKPQELIRSSGFFEINKRTQIIIDSWDSKIKKEAQYFVDQFNIASGYSLKIIDFAKVNNSRNSIILSNRDVDISLGDEGYQLKVYKNGVKITGKSQGLFYGIQTLFQLLPNQIYSIKGNSNIKWIVPLVDIKDTPRFSWRGMHLDLGRHLFSVDFIKKYIDYIAMHKMNSLHLHLTEDQGWRIEINKYPLLTEIGAWRKGTTDPELNKPNILDGKPYGGFYTQKELKDLVKYAQKRHITIVPEIELPGHCQAALASYPHLSCSGGPFEVKANWGINENIYCAGNDKVFDFLEDVLTEVMEIFPSEYIHVGGDEAPKTQWENCPKCKKRMINKGLKNGEELQSYFITRIEKFVNSKGRKIMGWDEIMQGGLAPNAAIMSWRGDQGGLDAAQQKHFAVMSPSKHCYFDLYQGSPEFEPRAMEGFVPIENVYNYNPIPKGMPMEYQKYILGVQGNVWTEFIKTTDQVEYMAFPRLSALSEVAWTRQENRELTDFLKRLDIHYGRLDQLEINYRWPRLNGLKKEYVFIEDIELSFSSKRKGVEIRYTMDGTIPTRKSNLFKKPFFINKSAKVRLREFTPNGNQGPTYLVNYKKQIPLKPTTKKNKQKGLKFEYFEFDHPIDTTLDLLKMKPIKSGTAQNIVFPFPNEELPTYFGLIFEGLIDVPETRVYSFSTNSNDGSRLYIDEKLVVDNDGWHGPYEQGGKIALEKGLHKIKILYFQSGGRKSLHSFSDVNNEVKSEINEALLFN